MNSLPRSVCPECLRPVRAYHEADGEDVYLVKHCPEHGTFRTIVWRGAPDFTGWSRVKIPSLPKQPFTPVEKGCPYDCGLCAAHRQHTCTAVMEITWRCDLGCRFCFASSAKKAEPDPSQEDIRHLLQRVIDASGFCNIQLSGGEPTIREDLPEIIHMAKAMGFPFVQLNTNGLRIACENGYAQRLADAGLDSVFLQFDGVDDTVYSVLRGKKLFAQKMQAIHQLSVANIGIVLVPTVVPGVNTHQLGDIITLATEYSPAVRAVHFQPVSYFGRYPKAPEDSERITLPEVMQLLETQTNGYMHATDFIPPGCEHSHCSFHANYMITEDRKLIRLSSGAKCGCTPQPAGKGATKAKSFVRRQWATPEKDSPSAAHDDLDAFIARAATHTLAVSAMAFQDAWTLDLERLKGCCIHIVSPDGRLIPFCAYNLTSRSGESLYRGKCYASVGAHV